MVVSPWMMSSTRDDLRRVIGRLITSSITLLIGVPSGKNVT
jgi:hypothetical protein